MTRRLVLLLAWLLASTPVFAQVIPPDNGAFAVTAASSGSCAATNCASFQVGGNVSLTLQVTGTFTATLTFEGTADGANWVSLLMTNLATGATATTTTAAGAFSVSNTGLLAVRARCTAFTSGTALVTATAGRSSRGGGGAGSGPFLANSGSVSAPAYSFVGATSVGFYRTASGDVVAKNNSADRLAYFGGRSGTAFAGLFFGGTDDSISTAKGIGWNSDSDYLYIGGPAGTPADLTVRHAVGGGTAPTVADTSANSCGSGTETITGNDLAGEVTWIGSAGTSCTVTFGAAFALSPFCLATNRVTNAQNVKATTSTTTVILAGTFAQNDVLVYVCVGR